MLGVDDRPLGADRGARLDHPKHNYFVRIDFRDGDFAVRVVYKKTGLAQWSVVNELDWLASIGCFYLLLT